MPFLILGPLYVPVYGREGSLGETERFGWLDVSTLLDVVEVAGSSTSWSNLLGKYGDRGPCFSLCSSDFHIMYVLRLLSALVFCASGLYNVRCTLRKKLSCPAMRGRRTQRILHFSCRSDLEDRLCGNRGPLLRATHLQCTRNPSRRSPSQISALCSWPQPWPSYCQGQGIC
jgi:hypothetical protein